MFLKSENALNYSKLKEVAKKVTFDLNKIIEANNNDILDTVLYILFFLFCCYYINFLFGLYFIQKTQSELGLKPNQLAIGLGIQGLADLFIKMKYPFDSQEAKELNVKIHETIYYGALEASCDLAAKIGSYKTYANSPAAKGVC